MRWLETIQFAKDDILSEVEQLTFSQQPVRCVELQSRSLIFIDPYGNQIINEHMDHESIHKVIKKYKKDYVPKYYNNGYEVALQNKILSCH